MLTGIYSLYQYNDLNRCMFSTSDSCQDAYSNIQSKYRATITIEVLFLVNILVLIALKISYFVYSVKKFEEHDGDFLTASDFAIMLKIECSSEFTSEAQIDAIITEKINLNRPIKEPEIKFAKKSMIYDSKDYVDMMINKMSLEKKLRIENQKGNNTDKLIAQIDKLKEKINAKRKEYVEFPFKYYTGWNIVTLNYQLDAINVSKRNDRIVKNPFSFHKNYSFKRAPEPEDIFWPNWAFPTSVRFRRWLIGNFCSFLVIGVNFGIILGLNYAQRYIQNSLNSSVGVFFINTAITIVVNVINVVISILLLNFANYESYRTIGDYYAAIVTKTVYSSFVNSALIILITHKIVSGRVDWDIFGFSGVMGTVMIMMILHVFTDSLLFYLDPGFLLRLYKQRQIRRKIEENKETVIQAEANEIFEALPADTYIFYNFCFKTVCMAFFYQSILPYGLLLGIVELTIKFLVFKYVLVNRYKRPVEHQLNFSLEMIELYEFLIFILGIGFTIFSIIFNGWSVLGRPILIIIYVICFAEWIGGVEYYKHIWNYQLTILPKSENDLSYNEAQPDFIYDYELMNPLTLISSLRAKLDEIDESHPLKIKRNVVSALEEYDNFSKAMDYYAVKYQNEFGNERIYHEEILKQNLEENANEKVDETALNIKQLKKINPYELLEENYYALIGQQNNENESKVKLKTNVKVGASLSEPDLENSSARRPRRRNNIYKAYNQYQDALKEFEQTLVKSETKNQKIDEKDSEINNNNNDKPNNI